VEASYRGGDIGYMIVRGCSLIKVKLSEEYGMLLEKWMLTACGQGEQQKALLDPMEVMVARLALLGDI
jgi:hypothetical protein